MQLESVTLYRIRIPFKQSFKHANAARSEADNVLLRCKTSDGQVGWGETVARDYVTGETSEGTIAKLAAIPAAAWSEHFKSPLDVASFLEAAGLAQTNVARCALEIALLDAFARARAQPLHLLLAECWPELAKIRNSAAVRYGGPYGLSGAARTALTGAKLRLFGFRDVKLKLGATLRRDIAQLRIARAVLGRNMDLRVDANEGWTLEHALAIAPTLKRCGVGAVEQPFPKQKNALNVAFARSTGLMVIADESLCSEQAARNLLADGIPLMFAVKLAKLGGFLSTLKILRLAEQHEIDVQIGCQVGESAILSAAGRQLAVLCPNLRYLEGSHDRYLLADNVTNEDITFEWGGRAPVLRGPGLGVEVDERRVERCAVHKIELFCRKAAAAADGHEERNVWTHGA